MTLKNLQLLGNYLDLLLDMLCVVDADGHFVYVSSSCQQVLGYQPHELIGQPMLQFVWPDDLAKTLAGAREVMAGGQLVHFENRYLHKNGQPVWLSWSARWSAADQVRVAIARDVSELRRAASQQQAMLAIAQLCAQDCSPEQLYQQLAQQLQAVLALDQFVVLQQAAPGSQWRCCYQWQAGANATADSNRLATPVARPDYRAIAAIWLEWFAPSATALTQTLCCKRLPDGWLGCQLSADESHVMLLLLRVLPASAEEQPPQGVIPEFLLYSLQQLNTALQRYHLLQKLQQQALYDQLTGLANRNLLTDRLEQACQRYQRSHGHFALLFIDLDNFKVINDKLGHQAGDLVLQLVARRLSQLVRRTDTVARFGGDEFVILLEPLEQLVAARQIADKICQLLAVPVELAGQSWQLSGSIGLALFPLHGNSSKQLMMTADSAMYQAKYGGGNQVCLVAGNPATP